MSRAAVAAALLGVAIALTGCTSSGGPAASATPTYLDGDLTKLPLDGVGSSLLHWEQPSDLTADQAGAALTLRRADALDLILRGGNDRPTGVLFVPLIGALYSGRLLATALLNGDVPPAVPPGGVGPEWVKVGSVSTTPTAAHIEFCEYDSGNSRPIGYSAVTLIRLGDAPWTLNNVADSTMPASRACAAWASALPSG